jgi:hypothetical protein
LHLCKLSSQTASAPSNGTGTSSNPYQIANLDNLYWIYANTSDWDKYYIQTADINASATSTWNSSTGWMPIGNLTTKFTGSYNGNGYDISGLSINRTASTSDRYQGLFGVIENASLTEIELINVSISGYSHVGAIVGYSINSILDKCYVSGTVSTPLSSGRVYAGGWCGFFTHTSSQTITNGQNLANVSSFEYVGGLIGYVDAPLSFENCSNSGNISASGSTSASDYAGGLVGFSLYNAATHRPSYISCTNTGTIAASAGKAGGIVGQISKGWIVGCSNSGNITSSNGGDVGGILGYGLDLYINHCTNTATTISGVANTTGSNIGGWVGYHSYGDTIHISNKTNNTTLSGFENVGGFFGRTDAPISFTNCHNTANLSASGGVTTSDFVGGLVGYSIYNAATHRPSYTLCTNIGTMSASAGKAGGIVGQISKGWMVGCSNSGNITSSNGGDVGGIVGFGLDLYINHCTNTATTISGVANTTGSNIGGWVGYHSYGDTIHISNKTNNTTLSGFENVGGFFGRTDAPISFTNCHNTANLSASGGVTTSDFVGGLVGYSIYNAATHRPSYTLCTNIGTMSASAGKAGGIVGQISKGWMVGCSNSGNITSSNGGDVGGIVGFGLDLYINHCTNTATTISGVANTTGSNIGGWVGYHSYGDTIHISNKTNNTTLSGFENVGGFFGRTDAPISFTNCHNTANLSASGGVTTSDFVGGLVGYSIYNAATHRPSYTSCTNIGTMSASAGKAGGIVGQISKGWMVGCSNSGNITSSNGGDVGGIVGFGLDLYINHCTNTATTISGVANTTGSNIGGWVGYHSYGDTIHISNKTNNTTLSGFDNVGGFFGRTDAPISFTNCHNTANLTVSGSITASHYIGGLVGFSLYNATTHRPVYRQCSNSGTITTQADIAGGLVGQLNKGFVDRCTNSGNIIASNSGDIGGIAGRTTDVIIYRCINSGSVTAANGDNAGGLIGSSISATIIEESLNLGAIRADNYAGGIAGRLNSTMKNCYNHGSVTADVQYSGGLVGYLISANIFHSYSIATFAGSTTNRNGTVGRNSTGTATNTYWNTSTGPSTTLAGTGSGRTTTQMQTQSNYVDWNFHTIWHLDSCATSNGYPILRWQLVDFDEAEPPTAGLGTSGAPFQISNLKQMYWLITDRKNWDKHYIQTATIDLTLTPKVCGYRYTPIGDRQDAFSGSYNGQHFKVQKLNIEVQTEAFPDLGMFGVSSGTLQNVLLEDVDIKGGSRIGGLLGHQTNGLVSQCGVISGTIECFVSGTSSIGQTGGLIGFATKDVNRSFVKQGVTVTSVNGQNTGGFLGMFDPSAAAAVQDNYSLATVSITGSVSTTPPGAFAGRLQATTGTGTRVVQRNYAAGPIATGQGFIGSSTTVTTANNFFDNQTTGQSTTAGTTAVGRSTSIMKSLTNYTSASWDFVCETANGTEDIWGRNSSDNLSYPFLMWEGFVPQCIFWVGGVSNDWATPSNWEPEEIPATGADIVFSPQAMRDLQLDISRTIGDLYFNASAKHVELGSNNLTMNGTVNGANATNYIKTNGTGLLIKNIPNSESFQFPVGNASYNPVTIVNNNSASDIFSVKVRDEVLVNGTWGGQATDPLVNATWDISKTNANASPGVDFTFQWESSQEANSISNYSLNHYNSTTPEWEFAAGVSGSVTGSTTKTMTHSDYTGTFSPFAIGSNVTPLPVDLVSFNAVPNNNSVDLTWTSIGDNKNPFNILKSTDGNTWTPIGTQTPSENSVHYLFTDHKPAPVNYYQLSQLDHSNTLQYSDIRIVNFNTNKITIFPNPNSGEFTIKANHRIVFQIIDYTGKVIMEGDNTNPLIKTNLLEGIYLIKITEGEKTTFNKMIVQ